MNKRTLFTILGFTYATFAIVLAMAPIYSPATQNVNNVSIWQEGGLDSNADRIEQVTESSCRSNLKEDFLISCDANSIIVWTSSWCGACKSFKPVVRALEKEGYSVYIMDFDSQSTLARSFGVQVLPTSFILKNGKIIKTFKGGWTRGQILRYLDKN